MAEPPNKFLRIAVPVAILVGGLVVAYAFMTGPGNRKPPASPPAQAQSTAPSLDPAAPKPTGDSPTAAGDSPSAAGLSPSEAAAAPTQPEVAPTAPVPPPAPAAAATTYSARMFDIPAAGFDPIGSLVTEDKGGRYEMEVRFAPLGAGIETLTLANHFQTVDLVDHEVVQEHHAIPSERISPRLGAVPFAAERVDINGQPVNLALDPANLDQCFWRQAAPGEFVAEIMDAGGAEAARITRKYVLAPDAYELLLEQKFENLGGAPLQVVWRQFGPVDLSAGTIRYGGDTRRIRFGYLLDPKVDPDRIVQGSRFLTSHDSALGKPSGITPATGLPYWDPKPFWPNDDSAKENLSLVWAGVTSRYFAVAVHAPLPTAAAGPRLDSRLTTVASVERFAMPAARDTSGGKPNEGHLVLRLSSPAITVAAGQTADVSLRAYAGPISARYMEASPPAAAVGLKKIIIYTFGGPCAFCTFQPITHLLRNFLGVLHDYVVFDWALAIMVLVVCVRSLLHPVTRWSQLNMLRFGKHMQALAPKQKAIQEKYGSDPKKMREEIARLMKEEHISYGAGAMGCLPMFLQTPVWIALYAMLYFTFELRHEPAFFGLFQALSGGSWHFLADLAEPDCFIPLGISIKIPLLSGMMGPIEAINILPLILGVVFFLQQKYLQPPTTATMTPEQLQQQKIMKVMMVVMFPVFMYNAPAGLSLYFIVNSTLGILESKWIRSHGDAFVAKKDAARARRVAAAGVGPGRSDRARGAKPEGFLGRLQSAVEERQKQALDAKKWQGKKKK